MAQMYNDPAGGTQSTIEGAGSSQMNTFYWQRRALVEAQKEMFFMPLADVTSMPKHYGKEIKVYHYMPLLDDRNVNDQGIDAAGVAIDPGSGNLYGSSKDIGTITSKLPLVGETGGRVNRVGFTRLQLSGTMQKFGFFTEFTQEALDFDSDADLYQHISREMVTGATQLSEAVLQKDLLAAAGVVVYAGDATSDATVDGESSDPAEVDYEDLMRLDRVLNDNRTPKQTRIISGSRMIDTRTVAGGRIAYIGSELQSIIEGMVDVHSNPAFIPVHKYAQAGNVLNGEIGSVGHFRFIVVPEMLHWAGEGAAITTNPGYVAADDTNYDVFPILVVGDGSFTTIGFAMGSGAKWKITTKMPGEKTADRNDPYGETGFSSIKWWYGTLIYRPERIAVVKTLAKV